MSTEKSDSTASDRDSAVDRAIARAKAAKALKADAGTTEGTQVSTASTKTIKEPKAPKVTDAEKAAKIAARDAERAAAKQERDRVRAEKKAAKEADRKPAHLSKVERAASKLPELSDKATLAFNEITVNLSGPELAALALHVSHFNRANATSRAASTKVEAGATVRIVGGDPRFVGKTGTVAKAQRIRCYVTVDGFTKDVYLFTSDVEVISNASSQTAANA